MKYIYEYCNKREVIWECTDDYIAVQSYDKCSGEWKPFLKYERSSGYLPCFKHIKKEVNMFGTIWTRKEITRDEFEAMIFLEKL